MRQTRLRRLEPILVWALSAAYFLKKLRNIRVALLKQLNFCLLGLLFAD